MFRALFGMWRTPRMVAWFVATTLLLLLVRLVFFPAKILPYTLDFNPGIVLIPLTGVFWGPAGAWGSAAAALAGDAAIGLWGPLSWFRAIGWFLFALTAKRLWDAYPFGLDALKAHHHPRWRRTIRFLVISWPGACVCAAWTALGTEMLKLYPFSYSVALLLVHHLVFTTLLGLALYRVFAREVVPHFGTWRHILPERLQVRAAPFAGAVMMTAGAFGSCIIGIWASATYYQVGVFHLAPLGTVAGPLVPVFVVLFLLLHLAGLFLWCRKGD